MQVRGAGGLDEELVREGPGHFRLFEAGRRPPEKDKDDVFLVTWQMTAPPVSVTLEVEARAGGASVLRPASSAPRTARLIGDAFEGEGLSPLLSRRSSTPPHF